jgi:hypothetical protein
VLPGSAQTPDAQLQQVQRKSGRQQLVLYRHQMWRRTRVNDTINTCLAIPDDEDGIAAMMEDFGL